MRSITTLALTLALGLTACTTEKGETESATATATATEAMTGTTAGTTGTTGGTTAEPTTGTTATPPTTTEHGTTTMEHGTTTMEHGTTTMEHGTTTGGTTGGGAEESPYNACASDDDCAAGALCINSALTGGQVKGTFCSPTCNGDMCPDAAADVKVNPQAGPQCLFGPMNMPPTNCGIVCVVGKDDCGASSDCEDIGQPPQMGVTYGICTHPA